MIIAHADIPPQKQPIPVERSLEHFGALIAVLFDARFQMQGEIRALQLVLEAVIASHPEPAQLHASWQRNLPRVTDMLATAAASGRPELTQEAEGWKRVLAHFSNVLEQLRDRAAGDKQRCGGSPN